MIVMDDILTRIAALYAAVDENRYLEWFENVAKEEHQQLGTVKVEGVQRVWNSSFSGPVGSV
jgi:hypothetical protein